MLEEIARAVRTRRASARAEPHRPPRGHRPRGAAAERVPFGLQLTGPRWSDRALLDLAGAWEAAEPWPLAAPGHDPFPVPA